MGKKARAKQRRKSAKKARKNLLGAAKAFGALMAVFAASAAGAGASKTLSVTARELLRSVRQRFSHAYHRVEEEVNGVVTKHGDARRAREAT
jgi:hypothetical protein